MTHVREASSAKAKRNSAGSRATRGGVRNFVKKPTDARSSAGRAVAAAAPAGPMRRRSGSENAAGGVPPPAAPIPHLDHLPGRVPTSRGSIEPGVRESRVNGG
jgi:hypothetical protein